MAANISFIILYLLVWEYNDRNQSFAKSRFRRVAYTIAASYLINYHGVISFWGFSDMRRHPKHVPKNKHKIQNLQEPFFCPAFFSLRPR